jgi:hypothetical protein
MTETEPAAAAVPPKSEAQAVYERLLEQCNRFNRIQRRLEQVIASIAAGYSVAAGDNLPSTKKHSYFDGLKMLADANDQVADRMEKSVEGLAKLF